MRGTHAYFAGRTVADKMRAPLALSLLVDHLVDAAEWGVTYLPTYLPTFRSQRVSRDIRTLPGRGCSQSSIQQASSRSFISVALGWSRRTGPAEKVRVLISRTMA